MYKYVLVFISALMFFACSSSQDLQEQKEISEDEVKNKAIAQEIFIEGSLSEMRGDYESAVNYYQQALKLDPTPGINFALAKNLMRIKKLPAALTHAKEAVKSEPNNSEYNYLLATIYQVGNQPDSAATIYNNIIANDSTDERAYYSLAQIYETSKPIKALELYNKLIDMIGPEWNVLVNIADLNERMGNVDATIETLEELIKVDPNNLQMKKLLIESYLKTENYEKSLSMSDQLLLQFPDDTNLLEYRANSLVQSGRWEEGAEEYMKLSKREDMPLQSKIHIGGAFFARAQNDSLSLRRAKQIFTEIDSDTTHWQIKLFLAQIAIEEGNDSLAVENYKKSSELAPWNPQILMSLGGLLFDSAKYEEAIKVLVPALERFPDEFVLNLILGLSYTQTNKSKEAEPYLKKALLLNPDDFTGLYAYGVTLNQLKKEEEALIYLDKALEQEPHNVSLIGTIGLIHENLGNSEKSAELYEQALLIDSTNALVLNNYAYALAERNVDLERALKYVSKALEFDSTNSSYLDTIGWVYFKMGEYEKAKYYIEQSLETGPDNAEVTDHLGDVYYMLNEKSKARELWESAFELDPEREGLKEKIEKGSL
ncbi:MAG: tetratricopeptide repeat protein [Melioribacteraceae bacterium]|nr:MAG: tetratricopeptide repeat protein [Melioribacteraceae bacterium]